MRLMQHQTETRWSRNTEPNTSIHDLSLRANLVCTTPLQSQAVLSMKAKGQLGEGITGNVCRLRMECPVHVNNN